MDESDSGRNEQGSPDGTEGGEHASDETPAADSVQDAAEARRRERTGNVEDTLAEVRDDLGNRKYPVSSEERSAAYADHPIDLPNETESLGSVFRRLDTTFEDEGAAYGAVVTELSTDEPVAVRANAEDPAGATWSEERGDPPRVRGGPDPRRGLRAQHRAIPGAPPRGPGGVGRGAVAPCDPG